MPSTYLATDYGNGYRETADSRIAARDRDLDTMHKAAMARKLEMATYCPYRHAEITVCQPYDGVYQVVGGPRFTSAMDVRSYADRIGADIVWSC